MSQRILTKLKAARASEVCQHFEVKADVRKYLENGPSPAEFIDLLLADKHYAAAISFMAHAWPLATRCGGVACACVTPVVPSLPPLRRQPARRPCNGCSTPPRTTARRRRHPERRPGSAHRPAAWPWPRPGRAEVWRLQARQGAARALCAGQSHRRRGSADGREGGSRQNWRHPTTLRGTRRRHRRRQRNLAGYRKAQRAAKREHSTCSQALKPAANTIFHR